MGADVEPTGVVRIEQEGADHLVQPPLPGRAAIIRADQADIGPDEERAAIRGDGDGIDASLPPALVGAFPHLPAHRLLLQHDQPLRAADEKPALKCPVSGQAAKADHKVDNGQMIDHIVSLVEERAQTLRDAKKG